MHLTHFSIGRTLRTGIILAVFSTICSVHAFSLSDAIGQAAGAQFKKIIEQSSSTPVSLPDKKGGFLNCQHLFPEHSPASLIDADSKWKTQELCFNNFAVLHSSLTKTPLVVIERLNKEQLQDAANEKRTDVFFADPRISSKNRSSLDDYEGSGFDRGHMSPAADQPDATSMAQSFALSNIVPQDPTNNRKIWAKIESDVRKFVRRSSGNVFVYSGPLFRGETSVIGPNKVWVPSHLFKLVYDETSGRAWAYVLPNSANVRVQAPVDYASFVNETGWNLLQQ